jgi:hypothetical protein
MADRTFIESIITVAEGLIKRDISSTERETIIDNFNKSNESTAYKKAIESLEKTLNIKLPKSPNRILIEKTANFDNINAKLSDMKNEADKWEQEKKDSK